MRIPSYLSPSAMSLFFQDQREYYLRYLVSNKLPAPPQTRPMSVGSAFDAYVKSYLHERLFGKGHDPKYDFDTLFAAQVETHNRDWARPNGQYVFDRYRQLGALSDLLVDLNAAIGTPRFEMEIKGVVSGYREGVTRDVKGVVLLGKPDVFYINKYGGHVILDWKVNGYCGSYKTHPMQGYIKLRPEGRTHRDCTPMLHKGTFINIASYLENYDASWAAQLSIYAWLLGCEVGEDYIVAIDQVVADGENPVKWEDKAWFPDIRVAEHRTRVHADFQFKTFAEAQYIWEVIHSDWIFRDRTKEESQGYCKILDQMAFDMQKPTADPKEKWFLSASRK